MKQAITDISSSIICLSVVILLFAGCVSEGGKQVPWVDIENAERKSICIVLNTELEKTFSFENHIIKQLDNGRLLVNANIRNRSDSVQKVEISTVFRENSGAVVDESAWKKIIFYPNQTRYYKISSVSEADSFTVRIRKTNQL